MSREIIVPHTTQKHLRSVRIPTETPVGIVENTGFVIGFDGDEYIMSNGPSVYDREERAMVDAMNNETGECVLLLIEGW